MCARMETRYESVKVFGLVDIEVIAAGSVFLGTVHEPIKGTKTLKRCYNQECLSPRSRKRCGLIIR